MRSTHTTRVRMLRFQMLQSIVSPGLSPRMRAGSSATHTSGVRSPGFHHSPDTSIVSAGIWSSEVTDRVRRNRRSKLRSGRCSIAEPLIAVIFAATA